jgi:hypothetical protein
MVWVFAFFANALAFARVSIQNKSMKLLIFSLSVLLAGCGLMKPKAENTSGLAVSIDSVKNHSEGVDLAVTLKNTTRQTMRLFNQGSVSVWLDGSHRVKGQLPQTVDIGPFEKKNLKMTFQFPNTPKVYSAGLLELIPAKVFRSCRAADADPEVVRDEEKVDSATMVIQPDTCDRALKKPIRIAF